MKDYLQDHYGKCVLLKCNCRESGIWLGRDCSNWRTFGANSFEDLKEVQARLNKERNGG